MNTNSALNVGDSSSKKTHINTHALVL